MVKVPDPRLYLLHSFSAEVSNREPMPECLFPNARAERSFFAEMSKREPMFECLVDGCGRKFKGDYQRQMHLIDSHKFPKGLHHLFHPTVIALPHGLGAR